MSIEKMARHAAAIHQSDFDFLKQSLRDAASRFSDLADIIEREPDKAVNQVGFLRASAERYTRAANLED